MLFLLGARIFLWLGKLGWNHLSKTGWPALLQSVFHILNVKDSLAVFQQETAVIPVVSPNSTHNYASWQAQLDDISQTTLWMMQ